MTTQNHDGDPICGNCGKPRSEHVTATWGLFCCDRFLKPFTSDPSDATLIAWMHTTSPSIVNSVRNHWKRHHGHGG